MATIIAETLDSLDERIVDYAETVFTDFAGPITTTIQVMGLVGLALLAINALVQFAPIRMGEYVKWGIRYVMVLSVATSWDQFEPIYNILTNTPGAIGAELLGATNAPNLNVALDDMITNIWRYSDEAAADSSFFDISLASIILWVIGGLMAAVAILVSAVAKLGLAAAVSFAPIFITALMFRATSDLFTSWSRFTLGFALIPLVLAGVMGVVIGLADELLMDIGEFTNLADLGAFLVVAITASIMMSQVPTMVNGLAGGIVATASGIREAQRGAGMIGSGAGIAGREALDAGRRLGAQGRAAALPPQPGDDAKSRMARFIEEGKRLSQERNANIQRHQDREAALGRTTTFSNRREAGRAGEQRAIRNGRAEQEEQARRLAEARAEQKRIADAKQAEWAALKEQQQKKSNETS